MADTTTTAKALTVQTVGGNSGTWGTIANANTTLIDKAIGCTLSKALTGDVTLTSTEAQNLGYSFTGALSAAATVTFPTFYGPIFVRNKTTGGYALTLGMASGTTVVVGVSADALIFSDGTNFFAPSFFRQSGATAAGTIYLDNTGAVTAAGANSIGTNGYIKHASGLIEQWGVVTFSASTTANVTFPLAFPSALFNIEVTSTGGFYVSAGSPTTSGFQAVASASTSNVVYWRALGN